MSKEHKENTKQRISLDDVEHWILNAMRSFPKRYKTDDWIITLLVDGETINELLLFEDIVHFDLLGDSTCSYVWRNDWYEGQQTISLIAMCPIPLIEPKYFVEYE